MDRISKALEMATQVRQGRDGSLQAETEKQIQYTRTRRVPISVDHLRENRIISGIDDKLLADSYRVLRTRVIHRMRQNNWKTLGITSAGAHEGKTLTAINLGISIAMKRNYTVILVDADMRRPNIHNLFGFEPRLDLSDYLVNGTPIEDILVHPGNDRFVILPGNRSLGDSSELLSSPRMVQLVQELKARYPSRIVLFDLPPALVGDDVTAFAPHLDASLLVVEDGETRTDELAHAMELMEGVELIGTVLNKSPKATNEHNYYYS